MPTDTEPRAPFPAPGQRFSREIELDPACVSAFAAAAGDENPLHHDPEHAARSRYGGLIASGAQTTSLLMSLTAAHFSRYGPMVGLEFEFRFRAAVPASARVTAEWLVIRVTDAPRLGGSIVDLRGRMTTPDGVTAVGAKGRVLAMMRT